MQEWVWRELRLMVPEDWEMLQFGRQRKLGTCAWADRYRFRLELSWKEVGGPPDFERMLSDYQQKLRDERQAEDFRDLRHGGWRGFEVQLPEGLSRRFGRHFDTLRRLVEVVFLACDPESATEATVLDSIRPVSAPAGRQRWRAFGLDLLASADLEMDVCRIQPGLAQFSFNDGRKGRRLEDFERIGLVEQWLKISLSEWLGAKDPPDLRERREERRPAAGHEILSVTGRLPNLSFPKLGRRVNHYDGAAWRCPTDGRLYYVGLVGPEPSPAPWGRRLRCCEPMRQAAA